VTTRIFKLGILAGLLSMTGVASATVIYTSTFSTAGTGGAYGSGNYYFTGQHATQVFSGTGLSVVNELSLTLNFGASGNYASQDLGLTFSLNGIDVGSVLYTPGDSTVKTPDFMFSDLVSASTDWTLDMRVTTPVCSGCGGVQLSTNTPMTLTDNAVPEPATIMMLSLGLAGFGVSRRRSA
jgi:hypothetical protein